MMAVAGLRVPHTQWRVFDDPAEILIRCEHRKFVPDTKLSQ
jgi:hypothetical protein